jgi:hypothetical protein
MAPYAKIVYGIVLGVTDLKTLFPQEMYPDVYQDDELDVNEVVDKFSAERDHDRKIDFSPIYNEEGDCLMIGIVINCDEVRSCASGVIKVPVVTEDIVNLFQSFLEKNQDLAYLVPSLNVEFGD